MGSRNLLQMAEFDGFSQICKTGIQQQQASVAEFGKIPAEMSMKVLEPEIGILEFGQQGPVRLQGWCNYDCRPFFARPPTPLKSSVELQNSACRVDTYPPLKTVGFRGFWPRYARLKTTHPPKVSQRQPGSTPTHPHADSEICNHNYTAPANEQGPAAHSYYE